MTQEREDTPHHFNLPIEKAWLGAVAVALVAQIFAGVWWAATQSAQMTNIEQRLHVVEGQLAAAAAEVAARSEKMARLEVKIENLTESNEKLSNHLAVIEGWLHQAARGK